MNEIFDFILTLYENRSWTTQVKTASRPTGTVIFAIGELKFGSGAARFFRMDARREKKVYRI